MKNKKFMLEMSEEYHYKLKLKAYSSGLTMQAYLNRLIIKHLLKHEQKQN